MSYAGFIIRLYTRKFPCYIFLFYNVKALLFSFESTVTILTILKYFNFLE